MLDHVGTLNPGKFLGAVVTASVEYGIDHILRLTYLKSVVPDVTPEQGFGLTLLLECLLVKFHHLERHNLRPAKVHVQAAVIIHKHVGVTVSVTAEFSYLLPLSLIGIYGTVDVTVVHGAANQLTVHLHDRYHTCRITGSINIGPVTEILGIPVSAPVGYKEEIIILKDDYYGFTASDSRFITYHHIKRVGKRVLGLYGNTCQHHSHAGNSPFKNLFHIGCNKVSNKYCVCKYEKKIPNFTP